MLEHCQHKEEKREPVCMPGAYRSRREPYIHRSGRSDSCEPSFGCWEANLDPLPEQPVLIIAARPPQPRITLLCDLEAGSPYVDLASLALSMQNRRVSKLERPIPTYLCLPGATMPGFTHQLLTATFMTLKGSNRGFESVDLILLFFHFYLRIVKLLLSTQLGYVS